MSKKSKHPKRDLTAPGTLAPPEKNGKGLVLSSRKEAVVVKATPIPIVDDSEWQKRIADFRKDATIADALSLAQHPRFKIKPDDLIHELRGYLVYANRNKAEARKIRVETLETALDVLHEMLVYKDRTGTMQMELASARAQLGSLYEACSTDLSLRKSVMGLRTVGDRGAVVEQVLQKIRRRLDRIDTVLDACEMVTKSLRETYNMLYLQIEIVKLIVYKRPDGAAQMVQTTTSRGTTVRHKHRVREE